MNWKRSGLFIFSDEKPPRLIAETYIMNVGLKQAEANAQLIASAPAMYEALKNIINLPCIKRDLWDKEGLRVLRESHKALAEAEGRE